MIPTGVCVAFYADVAPISHQASLDRLVCSRSPCQLHCEFSRQISRLTKTRASQFAWRESCPGRCRPLSGPPSLGNTLWHLLRGDQSCRRGRPIRRDGSGPQLRCTGADAAVSAGSGLKCRHAPHSAASIRPAVVWTSDQLERQAETAKVMERDVVPGRVSLEPLLLATRQCRSGALAQTSVTVLSDLCATNLFMCCNKSVAQGG